MAQRDSTEPVERPRHGVVAVVPRGDRLLVIRRSQSVVAPGQFCFPGGGIQRGEDEVTALVRELREELGVTIRPRHRLWRSTTPWDVRLTWWLAELVEGQRLTLDTNEVESAQWMTVEQLDALPNLLESNRHFLIAWRNEEFSL